MPTDLSMTDRCPTCFKHKAYGEEYGFLYGQFPGGYNRACVFRCCDNYWTTFEDNGTYLSHNMVQQVVQFNDNHDDRVHGYLLIWCIMGALWIYHMYDSMTGIN